MKKLLGLFFILCSASALAQINYDFEDQSLGDWMQYPPDRWNVVTDNVIEGNYTLAHYFDNDQADRDRLSLPVSFGFVDSTIVWRFRVQYGYNPSGSNHWGVFLMADTNAREMHPSGTVQGFLLGVNYSGTDDMLKLWKVQSGSGFEILNTGLNWQEEIGTDRVAGFQVELDTCGVWKIFLDSAGGYDQLHLLATVQNPVEFSPAHFGIYYEYTSSADRKFWFDDLYIGNPVPDTIAPSLDSVQCISSRSIELFFSEQVLMQNLLATSSYELQENQTSPVSVEVIDSFPSRVRLEFSDELADAVLYHLSVSNMCDQSGCCLEDTLVPVEYHKTEVTHITVESADGLSLSFSRPLDSLSAMAPENYFVSPGVGQPLEVSLSQNSGKVFLDFEDSWEPGMQYTLSVDGIRDINGDSLSSYSGSFYYTTEKLNDLVINEVMADPYPAPAGLPGEEYVEIFNRSDTTFNLSGWKLVVGETAKEFSVVTISPGDYMILCDNETFSCFGEYGEVYGFSSFPALRNEGDYVALQNPVGITINEIYYTKDWYHDPEKEKGGYALEKIDPGNNCGGIQNWKASCHEDGGTPGSLNSVDTVNIDTISPEIEYFEVINAHQVRVKFSEPLKPDEAGSVYNYRIDRGIESPYAALLNTPADNAVVLSFSKAMEQHLPYKLEITNMVDLCNNLSGDLYHSFVYHEVKMHDVVFSELLADPFPSVSLPETEYIELYNISGYPVYLNNWKLTIGDAVREIGEYSLDEKEYGILCDKEDMDLFGEEVKVFGMDRFPSIKNSGDPVLLEDRNYQPIAYVHFDDSWYRSDYKREGGWSLEQVDPANPCGGRENWKESVSPDGGTPGQENSVKELNPDKDPIRLIHAYVVDSVTVGLRFDEPYQSISADDPGKFLVENFGQPIGVDLKKPEYTTLELQFQHAFKKGVRYTLSIHDSITDCAGNPVEQRNRIDFELPREVAVNDVVINEVLFNPLPGGNDYVEVFNRSQKTIDLKEICLATRNKHSGMLDELCSVPWGGYLLFPGEYAVYTVNPHQLKNHYHVRHPYRIIPMNEMPGFSNDKGTVVLTTPSLQVIDEMSYREEMHFPLLDEVEGVSLERINYDRSPKEENNWHSASGSVGFGTPTYLNSQFSDQQKREDGRITVEPEVFSPDNDGFEDVVQIHYDFDEPGYVASVKVFNADGRMIRYLVNNQTLATKGVFNWDGLDDRMQLVENGIYVIYVQAFTLSGNVQEFKKPCVVGKRY